MSTTSIPRSVLEFLAASIETVPELEALVLIRSEQSRAWQVEDLASRLYLSPPAAMQVCTSLQRRGLVREAEAGRYEYSVASDKDRQVAEVIQYYQQHLVQVARLIHSGPSAAVREFARAFDFKKDK